jgi:hypothetical protein
LLAEAAHLVPDRLDLPGAREGLVLGELDELPKGALEREPGGGLADDLAAQLEERLYCDELSRTPWKDREGLPMSKLSRSSSARSGSSRPRRRGRP